MPEVLASVSSDDCPTKRGRFSTFQLQIVSLPALLAFALRRGDLLRAFLLGLRLEVLGPHRLLFAFALLGRIAFFVLSHRVTSCSCRCTGRSVFSHLSPRRPTERPPLAARASAPEPPRRARRSRRRRRTGWRP